VIQNVNTNVANCKEIPVQNVPEDVRRGVISVLSLIQILMKKLSVHQAAVIQFSYQKTAVP
jgi:hypothetical protein